MEFTVKRNDILPELTNANRFVEKQKSIPILNSIRIDTTDDRLHISATDLEVGIKTECPAAVDLMGSTIISAPHIVKIVQKLPHDKDIRFKVRERGMTVTCEGSQFLLPTKPVGDFPVLAAAPKKDPIVLPATLLRELIELTIFAINKTDSKYSCSGALLVLNTDSAMMVATDGHRIVSVEKRCAVAGIKDETAAILSRHLLIALQPQLKNLTDEAVVRFWHGNTRLFFEVDRRLIFGMELTSDFPNWKRAIPKDNGVVFSVGRDEISRALSRVSICSDGNPKVVVLDLEEGVLRLSTKSYDAREASEAFAVSSNNQPFHAGFNITYLTDFIGRVKEKEIGFAAKDGDTALLLVASSDDTTASYAVMPLRI